MSDPTSRTTVRFHPGDYFPMPMTSIERQVRAFVAGDHIKNLLAGEFVPLRDEEGQLLAGIRGRIGACGITAEGVEFGVDLIEMDPPACFPLHTHPGDHLLCVLQGEGIVHVDGIDHPVGVGDSIFVPADYPHGVKTPPLPLDSSDGPPARPFRFLAAGHPHKHVSASDRMHRVDR